MRCGRCLADTPVERHQTDGFTGYLCSACREEWERLTAPGDGPFQ